MLVPRNVARGIVRFADQDSGGRYALQSVAIERKDGAARAVSTDGRAMLIARWNEDSCAAWPEGAPGSDHRAPLFDTLVPADGLKRAAASCKPNKKAQPFTANVLLDEIETAKNGHVQLIASNGTDNAIVAPVKPDGRFPAWRDCAKPVVASRDDEKLADGIVSTVDNLAVDGAFTDEYRLWLRDQLSKLSQPREFTLAVSMLEQLVGALKDIGAESATFRTNGAAESAVHAIATTDDAQVLAVMMPMVRDKTEAADIELIVG